MAKVSQIVIGGIPLLNSSQKIDWLKFKNTPTTLVSASGHDHNDKFYGIQTVNDKFLVQEARITTMELQIETLSYKTDLMMGGGGSTENAIHNYNLSTETTSEISTTLNNSPTDVPGISSQAFGYFLNSNKAVSKFDYFTLINETVNDCLISPTGSLIDFAIQSKGLVTDGSNWVQLDTKLDIWASRPVSTAGTSGRQMLSSTVNGYTKGAGLGMLRNISYSSGVSSEIIEFTTIDTTIGLSKSSNKGYWISKVNGNFEQSYITDTVQAFTSMVNDADNSSISTTEFYGLIAGGGTGLNVQKLTWTTMAISASTNLTVNKNGASSIEQ